MANDNDSSVEINDIIANVRINSPQPQITTTNRKILVFCDGTGNDLFSKPTVTNVAIMATLVRKKLEHTVLYFPGPGVQEQDGKTASFATLIDQISAKSLDYKIKEIYSSICLNYNYGDKIYLFGFSRGSLIIRMLSNFIYFYGLIKREFFSEDKVNALYFHFSSFNHISNIDQIKTFGLGKHPDLKHDGNFAEITQEGYTWNDIFNGKDSFDHGNKTQRREIDYFGKKRLRETNFKLESIEFIGMFDTVPGLSIKNLKKELFLLMTKNHTWDSNDTRGEYFVQRFAHIMANDVTPFYINWSFGYPFSNYFNKENSEGACCWIDNDNYYEVRYPGDHCNIGGGWIKNPAHNKALSNSALRKMIKRVHFCGVNQVESIFEDIPDNLYPIYKYTEFKDSKDAIKSILDRRNMGVNIKRTPNIWRRNYWEWKAYNLFVPLAKNKNKKDYCPMMSDDNKFGNDEAFFSTRPGHVDGVDVTKIINNNDSNGSEQQNPFYEAILNEF